MACATSAAILLGVDVTAQVTQRVSLSSTGAQGNDHSVANSITPDCRYVAFESFASNLVPGDTNGWSDVFVRDRQNGTTERVSIEAGGIQGNGDSYGGWLSADGRFVAFGSIATNLVPADTNGFSDVFVRDRRIGTTERVSISSGGAQANNFSGAGPMTPDGRYVVIVSFASNLGPVATSGQQVFVRDRQNGTTELESVATGGTPGNSWSYGASISVDGRYVAFLSDANNLVLGDTNGSTDVFVHDRQSGTTARVNVASNGAQANYGFDTHAWISADGRYVAFSSDATNLVPSDTNNSVDAFVRDRQSGTTERVSVDSGSLQGNGDSDWPRISADGRYVVFNSDATNLVLGDTNWFGDVFIRDRRIGTTERVSIGSGGVQGNSDSGTWVPPSFDGRYVAFMSTATNLVPWNTNAADQVFIRDRFGGTTFTSLCEPGVGGVIACPCSNAPSGPGRGCDNSSATGGAVLSASGGTFLSSDSLVFTTSGEKSTALSMLLQGASLVPSGVVYGQGVRCTTGTFRRLYTKSASGGSITAPNFLAGNQQVSVRSQVLGDVILAGQSRWYLVYYRDPMVLGGCDASRTFNATQTGEVVWSP